MLTQASMKNIAAAYAASSDISTPGPDVMLYVNQPTLNPASVYADLIEASFVGYTRDVGTGVFTQYLDSATGEVILQQAAGQIFTCTTAPSTPQIVYGYALLKTTTTTLIKAYNFVNPVTVALVGDYVRTWPEFRFQPALVV